uniref:DNA-directed RNA polymerase n=1 Tax=Lambia antarctica TaxID=101717 RepID=A0A1L2EDU8_9CHLO|nr:DNA-directed RNA polymerase [Lambia antarctica]ANN39050.1 DNA-directed RNA polymerase [Lambia antarctica]
MDYFFDRCFEKKRLKQLLIWFFHSKGEKNTLQLLERLKNIGFAYSTKSGLSIGLEDLQLHLKKSSIYQASEFEVQQIEFHLKKSNLTKFEYFQQLVEIWTKTNEQLKDKIIKNFQIKNQLNPLFLMAFSGARGNISQVRQLVGMRGLMSDPKGQILDFPIRSNFREGLTLTEYIISCYGARKGIVDTALRTATSGYLTRRLVDVAQHVIIEKQDCQSKDFIWVGNLFSGKKILLSLKQRLVGRVLGKKMILQKKKKNYLKNAEITATSASLFYSKFSKIPIRSPLTCISPSSICQYCYGWNLATESWVSLGEAVGVLAAQSIGEPGTQLTMRTFHTGGVFSGDLIEQLHSPLTGQIFYVNSIAGNLIRTLSGKIAFLIKESSFIILKSFTKKKLIFKIPCYTILFLKNQQRVSCNQLVAELSSSSLLKTQQIYSEKDLYSEDSGQIFFQNLTILEKKKNTGEQKNYTQNLGTIWILKAHFFETFFMKNILPNNLDIINSNVVFQKISLNIEAVLSLNPPKKLAFNEKEKFIASSIEARKNPLFSTENFVQFLKSFDLNFLIYKNKYYFSLKKSFLSKKPHRGETSFFLYSNKINQSLGFIGGFSNSTIFSKKILNNYYFIVLKQNLRTQSYLLENNIFSNFFYNFKKTQLNNFVKQKFFFYNTKENKNYIFWTQKNIILQSNKKKFLAKWRNYTSPLEYTYLKKFLYNYFFVFVSCFFDPEAYRHKRDYFRKLQKKNSPVVNFYLKNNFFYENIFSGYYHFFLLETFIKKNRLINNPMGRLVKIRCLSFTYYTQNYLIPMIDESKFLLTRIEPPRQRVIFLRKPFKFADWFSFIEISKIQCCLFSKKQNICLDYQTLSISNNVCDTKFCGIPFLNCKIINKYFKQLNVLIKQKNYFRNKKTRFFINRSSNFILIILKFQKTLLKEPFVDNYKIMKPKKLSFKYFSKNKITIFSYSQKNFLGNSHSNRLKYFLSNNQILLILKKNYNCILKFQGYEKITKTGYFNLENSKTILTLFVVKAFYSDCKKFLQISNKLEFKFIQQNKFFQSKLFLIIKILAEKGEFFKDSFYESQTLPRNSSNFMILQKNHLVGLDQLYSPIFRLGDCIPPLSQVENKQIILTSGQVCQISKTTLLLRKANSLLLTSNGILHVKNSAIIQSQTRLFTMFYSHFKTGDIVQGIPKIEEFFEARQTRGGNPLFENLHMRLKYLYSKYKIQYKYSKAVKKALIKLQQIIVNEIQFVYTMQGIFISDKHIEIIIRQMTSKVKIIDVGSTGLLRGELVELVWVEKINKKIQSKQIQYEPIILGITKTCLETNSFISAASFQETTRILTKAAIQNKMDFICGLKENVILGHLIPAGTGFFTF